MTCRLNLFLIWKLLLLVTIIPPTATDDDVVVPGAASGHCRDRIGLADPQRFRLRTCAMCYHFLFPGFPHGTPKSLILYNERLVFGNRSWYQLDRMIEADPANQTTSDLICSTLNTEECQQWIECCLNADSCCNRQLTFPYPDDKEEYCSRTWDGFSCWDDAKAGSVVPAQCPSNFGYSSTTSITRVQAFYMHAEELSHTSLRTIAAVLLAKKLYFPNKSHPLRSDCPTPPVVETKFALKTCTWNVSWFAKNGHEWTDYKPCLDKEAFLIGVYISFGCCGASILLLVPAIFIFCFYRDLSQQPRIRVHVNFFISLCLSCITSIAWYSLVHHDLLVNPDGAGTVRSRNPVWCRVLSFFKIYFTSSTFFWMYCEGFYLHRLIANTFEQPKSLYTLYIFGWISPAVVSLIYGGLRAALDNNSCWVNSFGHYQWIIYVPNFVCLIMNLIFLSDILRILTFQMYSHPHEPSSFRRGLRAAFMLVPLFGLQMFVTIYRPPPGGQSEKIMEWLFFAITSSQGVFVALIFCFFNGEVLSRVRASCHCGFLRRRSRNDSPRSRGVSTQLTMITLGDVLHLRHSMSNVNVHQQQPPSPTSVRLLKATPAAETSPRSISLSQNRDATPTSCLSLLVTGSPESERKQSAVSTLTYFDKSELKNGLERDV